LYVFVRYFSTCRMHQTICALKWNKPCSGYLRCLPSFQFSFPFRIWIVAKYLVQNDNVSEWSHCHLTSVQATLHSEWFGDLEKPIFSVSLIFDGGCTRAIRALISAFLRFPHMIWLRGSGCTYWSNLCRVPVVVYQIRFTKIKSLVWEDLGNHWHVPDHADEICVSLSNLWLYVWWMR
jgi:hypothetical protein